MIYEGTDLKWIIPYVYLTSDSGSFVYVISPWIDIDVALTITWVQNSATLSFSELIKSFSEKKVGTVFFLSETEKHNSLNVKSLRLIEHYGWECHFIKNLHSKAVVGLRLMYIGSANLTYSGLNKNQEAVTIERVYDQKENLKQLLGGVQAWQNQRVK